MPLGLARLSVRHDEGGGGVGRGMPNKRPKPRFSMNKHYAELATQIEGMDMFSKKNHTFDRLRLSKDRNDLEERVDEGAQRQGEATGYSGHDHALPTDARQGEERGTGDWQAETASRLGSKFRYDPDRPRHISQGLPYAGAGVETMRPNVSGEGGQGAGIGGQVLERLGREVGGGRKSVADMVQAASLPSRKAQKLPSWLDDMLFPTPPPLAPPATAPNQQPSSDDTIPTPRRGAEAVGALHEEERWNGGEARVRRYDPPDSRNAYVSKHDHQSHDIDGGRVHTPYGHQLQTHNSGYGHDGDVGQYDQERARGKRPLDVAFPTIEGDDWRGGSYVHDGQMRPGEGYQRQHVPHHQGQQMETRLGALEFSAHGQPSLHAYRRSHQDPYTPVHGRQLGYAQHPHAFDVRYHPDFYPYSPFAPASATVSAPAPHTGYPARPYDAYHPPYSHPPTGRDHSASLQRANGFPHSHPAVEQYPPHPSLPPNYGPQSRHGWYYFGHQPPASPPPTARYSVHPPSYAAAPLPHLPPASGSFGLPSGDESPQRGSGPDFPHDLSVFGSNGTGQGGLEVGTVRSGSTARTPTTKSHPSSSTSDVPASLAKVHEQIVSARDGPANGWDGQDVEQEDENQEEEQGKERYDISNVDRTLQETAESEDDGDAEGRIGEDSEGDEDWESFVARKQSRGTQRSQTGNKRDNQRQREQLHQVRRQGGELSEAEDHVSAQLAGGRRDRETGSDDRKPDREGRDRHHQQARGQKHKGGNTSTQNGSLHADAGAGSDQVRSALTQLHQIPIYSLSSPGDQADYQARQRIPLPAHAKSGQDASTPIKQPLRATPSAPRAPATRSRQHKASGHVQQDGDETPTRSTGKRKTLVPASTEVNDESDCGPLGCTATQQRRLFVPSTRKAQAYADLPDAEADMTAVAGTQHVPALAMSPHPVSTAPTQRKTSKRTRADAKPKATAPAPAPPSAASRTAAAAAPSANAQPGFVTPLRSALKQQSSSEERAVKRARKMRFDLPDLSDAEGQQEKGRDADVDDEEEGEEEYVMGDENTPSKRGPPQKRRRLPLAKGASEPSTASATSMHDRGAAFRSVNVGKQRAAPSATQRMGYNGGGGPARPPAATSSPRTHDAQEHDSHSNGDDEANLLDTGTARASHHRRTAPDDTMQHTRRHATQAHFAVEQDGNGQDGDDHTSTSSYSPSPSPASLGYIKLTEGASVGYTLPPGTLPALPFKPVKPRRNPGLIPRPPPASLSAGSASVNGSASTDPTAPRQISRDGAVPYLPIDQRPRNAHGQFLPYAMTRSEQDGQGHDTDDEEVREEIDEFPPSQSQSLTLSGTVSGTPSPPPACRDEGGGWEGEVGQGYQVEYMQGMGMGNGTSIGRMRRMEGQMLSPVKEVDEEEEEDEEEEADELDNEDEEGVRDDMEAELERRDEDSHTRGKAGGSAGYKSGAVVRESTQDDEGMTDDDGTTVHSPRRMTQAGNDIRSPASNRSTRSNQNRPQSNKSTTSSPSSPSSSRRRHHRRRLSPEQNTSNPDRSSRRQPQQQEQTSRASSSKKPRAENQSHRERTSNSPRPSNSNSNSKSGGYSHRRDTHSKAKETAEAEGYDEGFFEQTDSEGFSIWRDTY